MMELRKESDEVWFSTKSTSEIVRFGREEVEFLKRQCLQNPRGKARICLHESADELFQEMLIALRPETLNSPHKHLRGGGKSYKIVEGSMNVVIYDNQLREVKRILLSSDDVTALQCYARVPEHVWHTVKVISDPCVFLEAKTGPFKQEYTEWAGPR